MDPCPVLVGRQQELATLRSLLDAGGGVALVSGEAGIGKSRLVREFSRDAITVGRIVLWARPEEVAQPGPYALIVDLLESIAENGGVDVKAEARSLVSELSRGDGSGAGPAPAPRAVAAEVRGLLSQLGRPPLIVLEDLHWGDEQSHSVVMHLARAAADDKHIVLLTLRPERGRSEVSLGRLLDTLSREHVAVGVELQPLGPDEMARMLEFMWERPPTEEEVAELVRLGEGVPFFVEELASSMSEGDRVRVPRSIEQSVAARVADLGEEASRVLATASLMGGALDVPVLALACDLPEERVADHLTAAARAGLLADNEDRLVFRHSLVREAVVASLLSVEAGQTHGRLASAIEKVHADELDAFAAALAHHYKVAGDRSGAVSFAVRAGNRALAYAATEEARQFFIKAIDIDGGAVEAKRGLAEVEFRDGNEAAASGLFREVADMLLESGRETEASQALSRLAWTLQGRVEPASVIRVLDEALSLLTRDGAHRDSARIMVQKGSIQCFLLNQTQAARPTLEGAIAIAREREDAVLIAESLDALAQADELDGDLDAALRRGKEAVEVATSSGSAEVIGRTHNNYALKLAISGRPSSALDVLSAGRVHLEKKLGRAALAALDVSEAWVSWLMGRPSDVARLTARGKLAWQRWRGYRWILETWSSVEQGELSRATAIVEEAWASLGGETQRRDLLIDPARMTRDESAACFAEVVLGLGTLQLEDAVPVANALVEFSRSNAERFDFGQALIIRAAAHVAGGSLEAAEVSVRELGALSSDYQYPLLRAQGMEVQTLLDVKRDGVSIESTRLLEQAVSIYAQCDNFGDQARCLRLLSEYLIASKADQAEVRNHLKRARDLAERAGASVQLGQIEALARQMGLRLRGGRSKRISADDKGQLSPRETEVAAFVAEGETNASIAAKLFLSERTVQDHITHALKKLHLPGRAALASWAARNGLL